MIQLIQHYDAAAAAAAAVAAAANLYITIASGYQWFCSPQLHRQVITYYGMWFVVFGLWFLVFGLWFMVYGWWFMV